ncbi:MAG TPA: nidogen-like domain-containing protein, partial [Fibrella sp.]
MKRLLYLVLLLATTFGISDTAGAQNCLIARDATWTQVARGDDNSTAVIPLGFTFNLYGTPYTQVYINTNGNVSFGTAVSTYSSTGFPANTAMLAPFWADVDTRSCGGAVYYKLYPTRMEILWDGVGYYSQNCTKINTFQLVFGTTNDPVIGAGNNVRFNYGDMQWTTGDASQGAAGFGGTPATVGINEGNGVDYVQVGLFNQNNSTYDGPGGATDGVDYLDNKCFVFNATAAGNQPPSFSGLPTNNTINLTCGQAANYSIQALGPEVGQTVTSSLNTGGLCGVTSTITNGSVSTTDLSIQASACNVGTHTLTLSATDNGSPAETSTVTITVNVTAPTASITGNGGAVCAGGNASFTLGGTSGATVTYNINNGSNATATLTGGTATVAVPGATADQTLNLVSVTSGGCTTGLSGTSTVTVNPGPTATISGPSAAPAVQPMTFGPGGVQFSASPAAVNNQPSITLTGGRTGFYSAINTAPYSGLWFTFNPIKNPWHSSQGGQTGDMVFSNYDANTGIITFVSTGNI